MKKFLLNFTRFFVAFAALAGVLILVSATMIKKSSFKVPENKTILVLGDSHTECAIDDNVFSRAINVSSSATSYLYSYTKLKSFVSANPQIDTVILSYHYGSLDADLDNKYLYEDALLLKRIPTYFPFLEKADVQWFLKNPAFYKGILRMPKVAFGAMTSSMKSEGYTYRTLDIGAYNPLEKNSLNEDIKSRKGIVKKESYSKVELSYLRNIVSYCKERGIFLILLSTPVYHAEAYTDVAHFKAIHQQFSTGAYFIDLTNYSLPTSAFADISHLNSSGAKVFSRELEQQMGKLAGNNSLVN